MKSLEMVSNMKRKTASIIGFALLWTPAAAPAAFPQALPKPTTQTAGQRSPVAPTKEQIQAVINEAYEKYKSNTEGKNADYIPALAQVDSKLFGIVVISTDGQIVTAGDIDKAFSIQSIPKVYSLALAMNELGAAKVFEKIGSEPTGRP